MPRSLGPTSVADDQERPLRIGLTRSPVGIEATACGAEQTWIDGGSDKSSRRFSGLNAARRCGRQGVGLVLDSPTAIRATRKSPGFC